MSLSEPKTTFEQIKGMWITQDSDISIQSCSTQFWGAILTMLTKRKNDEIQLLDELQEIFVQLRCCYEWKLFGLSWVENHECHTVPGQVRIETAGEIFIKPAPDSSYKMNDDVYVLPILFELSIKFEALEFLFILFLKWLQGFSLINHE